MAHHQSRPSRRESALAFDDAASSVSAAASVAPSRAASSVSSAPSATPSNVSEMAKQKALANKVPVFKMKYKVDDDNQRDFDAKNSRSSNEIYKTTKELKRNLELQNNLASKVIPMRNNPYKITWGQLEGSLNKLDKIESDIHEAESRLINFKKNPEKNLKDHIEINSGNNSINREQFKEMLSDFFENTLKVHDTTRNSEEILNIFDRHVTNDPPLLNIYNLPKGLLKESAEILYKRNIGDINPRLKSKHPDFNKITNYKDLIEEKDEMLQLLSGVYDNKNVARGLHSRKGKAKALKKFLRKELKNHGFSKERDTLELKLKTQIYERKEMLQSYGIAPSPYDPVNLDLDALNREREIKLKEKDQLRKKTSNYINPDMDDESVSGDIIDEEEYPDHNYDDSLNLSGSQLDIFDNSNHGYLGTESEVDYQESLTSASQLYQPNSQANPLYRSASDPELYRDHALDPQTENDLEFNQTNRDLLTSLQHLKDESLKTDPHRNPNTQNFKLQTIEESAQKLKELYLQNSSDDLLQRLKSTYNVLKSVASDNNSLNQYSKSSLSQSADILYPAIQQSLPAMEVSQPAQRRSQENIPQKQQRERAIKPVRQVAKYVPNHMSTQRTPHMLHDGSNNDRRRPSGGSGGAAHNLRQRRNAGRKSSLNEHANQAYQNNVEPDFRKLPARPTPRQKPTPIQLENIRVQKQLKELQTEVSTLKDMLLAQNNWNDPHHFVATENIPRENMHFHTAPLNEIPSALSASWPAQQDLAYTREQLSAEQSSLHDNYLLRPAPQTEQAPVVLQQTEQVPIPQQPVQLTSHKLVPDVGAPVSTAGIPNKQTSSPSIHTSPVSVPKSYNRDEILKGDETLKALTKQLADMNSRLTELQTKLESLQAKNESIQKSNSLLNTENKSLKGENASLNTENESLKGENASLKTQKEALQEKTKTLTQENQQLVGLRAENKELKNTLVAEKARLNEELTESNDAVKKLNAELLMKDMELRVTRMKAERATDELKTENEELKTENQELKTEKNQLNTQLSQEQAKYTALDSQFNEMRNNFQAVKNENNTLKQTIKEQDEKIASLKEEKTSALTRLETAQKTLQEKQQELQNLTAILESSQKTLQEKETELEAQKVFLESSQKALQEKTEDLKTIYDKLGAKNQNEALEKVQLSAAHEFQNEQLAIENNELKQNNFHLESEVTIHKENSLEKDKTIQKLQFDLEEAKNNNQIGQNAKASQLQTENDQLKARIAQLESQGMTTPIPAPIKPDADKNKTPNLQASDKISQPISDEDDREIAKKLAELPTVTGIIPQASGKTSQPISDEDDREIAKKLAALPTVTGIIPQASDKTPPPISTTETEIDQAILNDIPDVPTDIISSHSQPNQSAKTAPNDEDKELDDLLANSRAMTGQNMNKPQNAKVLNKGTLNALKLPASIRADEKPLSAEETEGHEIMAEIIRTTKNNIKTDQSNLDTDTLTAEITKAQSTITSSTEVSNPKDQLSAI